MCSSVVDVTWPTNADDVMQAERPKAKVKEISRYNHAQRTIRLLI